MNTEPANKCGLKREDFQDHSKWQADRLVRTEKQ